MDFGVDWRPASSTLSLERSLFATSVNSVTITSVDSDGFLPWGGHRRGSEVNSSLSSCGPNPQPPSGSNNDGALNKSALSSNQSDPSCSSSVDSRGFLDWGESARACGSGNSPADLDGVCTTIDGGGEKKGSSERDDDVADGLVQGETGETWRIEDYEGSNDYAKRSGPGHMPFAKIRLAFRMPGAKSQRPAPAGAPGDKFIKNVLLKQGRRSTTNEAMLLPAINRLRESAGVASDSNRRKSAFAPLFGKSRKDPDVSTSFELDDDYYSGPSIHLNREDGVDIGELRRELKLAMRNVGKSPM